MTSLLVIVSQMVHLRLVYITILLLLKIMWHMLPYLYRVCSTFQGSYAARREALKTDEVLILIKSKAKKHEACSNCAETCSICLVDFES